MTDVEQQMQTGQQQNLQPGQQPDQFGQQPHQSGQQAFYPGPGEQTAQQTAMDYVKSGPGVFKIIEFVLLLIAFSSGVACCTGFFIWATIIAMINVVIFFILFARGTIQIRGNQGKWSCKMMANSLVWCIILVVLYSLLINHGRTIWYQGYKLPASFYISAVFGIFSAGTFFLDSALYNRLRRSRDYQ